MKSEVEKKIQIELTDGSIREVPYGISLEELSKEYIGQYPAIITAARVDEDLKELVFRLYENCKVEFVDITDDDGMRMYRRSATFLLIKAVHELYPDRKVVISHSISKGLYCEIRGAQELSAEEVACLERRMKELVEAAIPFTKREVGTEEARKAFLEEGRLDRYRAIEHRTKPYVTLYECDGLDDYFYGYMVPHTGYVRLFALKHYAPGVIILFPDRGHPGELPDFQAQKKLFGIFKEFKQWVRVLGVDHVGALNQLVSAGEINELVRIAEAFQEKKLAQIADMITSSEHRKRMVLISGPSSSGKTTFAKRLSIQLRVNGLRPVTISLDDYFVDRDQTPKDEFGQFDFEALEAIDIKLFNEHLSGLIRGLEQEIPIFNFPKGCREKVGKKLKVEDDQILIIEGIHGLNEVLTASVARESKFKIYVSALTSLNIDDHNRIPTTDARMLRRIVRDYQFRGCSAQDTINRWPSVRRGEEKNIFPFQEDADIMFNSSLVYELGLLKTYAEPLLAQIQPGRREYSEARRLLEFLSYFLPIENADIPGNSIIREFIGGSTFA